MYGKKKARGDAAKTAVTGSYKKSRTKGMDKPDPKRRGKAAYLLLVDIRDSRRNAERARESLSDYLRDVKKDKKEGKHYPSPKTKGLMEGFKEDKVDAHRQVQALKQAYNKLPATEKAAGQRVFKKEQSK